MLAPGFKDKIAADKAAKIEQVGLIFKTHLDLGYTDSAATVMENYFSSYLPKAIALAEKSKGTPHGFKWTVPSYLIAEYLENYASAEQQQMMETAIHHDLICWHALPFTTHTELMDKSLFDFAIRISKELDLRFGKNTIGAKMTDVPGHTKAIIGPLQEAGVKLLHIGVNAAATLPECPDQFVWQADDGKEIIVLYNDSYGGCAITPRGKKAFLFCHTGDNEGPPSFEEVQETYRELSSDFPQAEIFKSDLNDMANAFYAEKSQLPIFKKEIGDSWIHGVASDPWKGAKFNELKRWRSEKISENPARLNDPGFKRFSKNLLLVCEHTWGAEIKRKVKDRWEFRIEGSYDKQAFMQEREAGLLERLEESWLEQRNYLEQAVDSLSNPDDKREARAILNRRDRIEIKDKIETSNPREIGAGDLRATVLPSGGILIEKNQARFVVKPPVYTPYGADEMKVFLDDYVIHKDDPEIWAWAGNDYGKPGLEKTLMKGRSYESSKTRVFESSTGWVIEDEFSGECVEEFGCPKQFMREVSIDDEGIRLSVSWQDKSASRIPESISFDLVSETSPCDQITVKKIGQHLDLAEVTKSGGKMHACSEVTLTQGPEKISVKNLHSPLVMPTPFDLISFPAQPDQQGISFCLWNSLWNTNFPIWCDEDHASVFILK